MGILRSLLRIILAAVAAIVLLLLAVQDKMIYHPRPYPAAAVREFPRIQPIPYTTSQGQQQCYFIPAKSGAAPGYPIWVLFSGNASLALEWQHLIESYPDRNASFLLIDYPGYGACNGHPSPKNIIESADAAFAALSTNLKTTQAELEPRLKVMGHSLGAANALHFASHHPASSVVLIAPFSSLREMAQRTVGWPLCYLLRGNFDNRARMREITNRQPAPDIHILSGTDDDLIPFTMGRDLATLSTHAEFKAIEGAGHNDILVLAQDQIFKAMQATSARKP